MAIFGKAVVLTPYEGQMFEYVLREGNNWDVFLNYFFAVLFIFCFVIGIVLNPFIIAYHAQQKRTFAKVLFLLVSFMDLFKTPSDGSCLHTLYYTGRCTIRFISKKKAKLRFSNKVQKMAIFGKAVVLTPYEGQMFEYVLREGNNWDVFLNYFFAVLFIFCFVIGIVLNPFIIAYHAQQKRTFAKVLFLLVSSMDLFKCLYFPLVLVPKLLSPLGEDDYYLNEDLSTVSWTAYANNFVMPLSMFEIDVLAILSIVRYSSVANPLSSKRVMNIILTAILTFDIMLNVVGGCLPFFYEPIVYERVIDMLVCIDELFISNIFLPLSYSLFAETRSKGSEMASSSDLAGQYGHSKGIILQQTVPLDHKESLKLPRAQVIFQGKDITKHDRGIKPGNQGLRCGHQESWTSLFRH
ncbi:hypothetical protein ACHWQZ_G008248 [Mnemiopsis leidyi]